MPPASRAADLRTVVAEAARGLVEREVVVELVVLAAVAGEHLLVIGPPGTAKSEAVRRVAEALGGRYFEYLLGRFTEPSELFGPIDLRKLKEGLVETATAGMLPEAEIAFLDEIFRGSTAILNTLLGILNERTFRRGHTLVRCPLRVCVGAANALPEDESLAAFADRFLVRAFLEPVPDTALETLLESGFSLADRPSARGTIATLDQLSASARTADLGALRPQLAHAIRTLRGAGIALSDRRIVRSQRLVAAAAALAGREAPTEADLWPILYVVPTGEAQALARDVLGPLLSRAESPTLGAAAEAATDGPGLRASRLEGTLRALLEARPEDAAALAPWRRKLEGVLRELDASLAPDARPEALAALRALAARELEGGAATPS